MPSVTQRIQVFRQFSRIYALQEISSEGILQTIPSWHHALLPLRQKIRSALKANADNISQHTDYANLVEHLRSLHAAEISTQDVSRFMEEVLILYLVLEKEDQHQLLQCDELSGLLKITSDLVLPQVLHKGGDDFSTYSAEINHHLLPEQRYLCWQLLLSQQPPPYPLSPSAVHQLSYLHQYLMKRQLGINLEEDVSRMLWLNTLEPDWPRKTTPKGNPTDPEDVKNVSLATSVIQFALHWLAVKHHREDTKHLLWANPFLLTQAKQGQQTQLFGEQSATEQQLEALKENPFHAITLDLREPYPPYPYIRNLLRQNKQSLTDKYGGPESQQVTPSQVELLLSWAEDRRDNHSLLLLLLERDFLSEDHYKHLRRYMSHHYPQIFVVDSPPREEAQDAFCAVFLVAKEHVGNKARIQYTALKMPASPTLEKLDFEELSWKNIDPDRQSYWIGLPDSDFFDLIPLTGTDTSFFRDSTEGIQSLATEWLMDDDERRLQKKIRYLIKEYQKGLSPGKKLSEKITWPNTLRQMAKQSIPLEYNPEHIQKVMVRPSVESYMYADEMLLNQLVSNQTQIMIRKDSADAAGSIHPAYAPFFSQDSIFPLKLEKPAGLQDNITSKALDTFRKFYHKRARSLDSHFIVFPPENITQTLDKIASVSRDLPVLRKYPEQINRMLTDARDFTSDVELLAPPYEKIEEFRRKVLRLERDAIERRVIYQRVKSYIDELKEQLSMLTREYDEAQRDLEAVNKENLFYYLYAVLQDPSYAARYKAHLQWELPRVPMYPHFRKWVRWGKDLLELHSLQKEMKPFLLQKSVVEKEKGRAKKLGFTMNQENGSLLLEEGHHSLLIEGIPPEAFQYQVFGKTLLEHYLTHIKEEAKQQEALPRQLRKPTLPDFTDEVFQRLAELCTISVQTISILEAIDNTMTA